MSLDAIRAALSPNAQRATDPATPMPMRMMAAKGMAPLPGPELVGVVVALTLDSDPSLSAVAQETLAKLPDKVLGPALDSGLPEAVLQVLALTLLERPALLEKLVLHRQTPDSVLVLVAPRSPAEIVEILANNQERLLRSEPLVRAIVTNRNMLRSSVDRIFDFLVRSGVLYTDMHECADAIVRLSPHDIQQAVAQVELPEEVLRLFVDDTAPAEMPLAVVPEVVAEATAGVADPASDNPGIAPEVVEGKEERLPVLKLIATLNPAQRIALAIRGNREARTLLVRDPNRVVAAAAIRSPRITEQEVISAAQSRSVCDEVIRVIANTREMMRPYGVKVALVNNPKTPAQTAMHMLTLLRASDLRMVAKSKNVSAAVANHAKRLVLAKGGGK